MRKTRSAWTQKDIRLSKTAGFSHPTTGPCPAGRPRRALRQNISRDRSPIHLRPERLCDGGADRVRTDDLRLAKPALSQLSYSPEDSRVVRAWWAWVDLNYRPPAYQADALTN